MTPMKDIALERPVNGNTDSTTESCPLVSVIFSRPSFGQRLILNYLTALTSMHCRCAMGNNFANGYMCI